MATEGTEDTEKEGKNVDEVDGVDEIAERSDAEVYGRRAVTVPMGGADWRIHPLPRRRSRVWRESFRAELAGVAGLAEAALSVWGGGAVDAPKASAALLDAGLLWDTAAELVGAWAEAQAAEGVGEDVDLDAAFDEEVLGALWEIVKLTHPTSRLRASGAAKTLLGMVLDEITRRTA